MLFFRVPLALKEKEALRVNQVQKVKKEEQEKMALMEHL